MKRTAVAVLLLVLCWSAPVFAGSPEEAGVRAAIQHYFDGHATGDGEHFRKAFHPEARLLFIRDGKFTIWPVADYIARAPGKAADDEAQRKRWIETIDIVGDAATVKLVLDYPSVRFTDYMTLLKVDGEWKIVNKSFYADRKQPAAAK